MKKTKVILTVVFLMISVVGFSQIFKGGGNKMEEINNTNNSDLSLQIHSEQEVKVLSAVTGSHTGFSIIPLIFFLPKISPAIVRVDASQLAAEENALHGTDGEIILNKRVESTRTNILFIVWIEKITVSGYAAKIKK